MISMKIINRSLIILGLSLSVGASSQQRLAYTGTPSLEGIKTVKNAIVSELAKNEIDFAIERLQSESIVRNANWGFVIYDPESRQVVTSYNENTPLVPASTTKLLSTETAMNIMGTKFQYNTQLEYSGTVSQDGVLEGNLYIIGSGDFSLGTGMGGASRYSAIVSDFIQAIKNEGINKINGNIYVETAVFKNNKIDLPQNIVWLAHNNYYLPVGNTQGMDPRKEMSVIPPADPFHPAKHFFYISPYTGKMAVTDSFEGNKVYTKIPDAPLYLAKNLRVALPKSGVVVSGGVETKTQNINPEATKIIANYKSPSLSTMVYYTNQNSVNRFAEAILRAVGFYKDGDETLDTGRSTILTHLKNKGYDFAGINLVDGSGLSRSNEVKPISQAKFLAEIMKEPYYQDFLKSLPVAGQTGTLKRMFVDSEANGKIFAKTGTLKGVKCLAGYIHTYSGKVLTFSLLVNNYSGSVAQIKSKMETLLTPAIDL